MKKIPLRENGLVGTFFHLEHPSSAIIVLGGSGGGLSESRAELLASQGFSTLALAYFGAGSLPPTLSQIPLEYFEKAIYFLKNQPGIQRIGLWGGSRGAELSLILGSVFRGQIGAIVSHVPSSVVYGALEDPNVPAWTYRGKPIVPNAPFQIPEPLLGYTEDTAIASTPCFLSGMEDKEAYAASAIAVEKIQCPLLLISAQDDQMWPSFLFAQQIVDRLQAYRSSIPCLHLSYLNVGHAPSKGVVGFHPIMKRWFVYGGDPQANTFAAQDWWDQTVHFFKTRL